MSVALFLRKSNIASQSAPPFFICNSTRTTIGRHGNIKIDTSQGKEISKIHCKLYRRQIDKDEYWVLEDNKSLNGTFVNGRKIHRVIIKNGDEIVFGGGKQFKIGEKVASTDEAECRYTFYLPPPSVKFLESIDPNAIYEEDPNSADLCPICYCSVVGKETLPCGHSFCINCIHEWARVCVKSFHPCVCPICRAIFHQSELSPEEGTINSDGIIIHCVQPFLHALNVNSCRVVKGANIFKSWSPAHRKWFFAAYNTIKDSYIRRVLFLYITKANIFSILKANSKDLAIALNNLEIEPLSQSRDGYLVPLLQYICENFTPTPPLHTHLPRPQCFIRYY